VTGITKHLFQDLDGAWLGHRRAFQAAVFAGIPDSFRSGRQLDRNQKATSGIRPSRRRRVLSLPAAPRCIERYHARIADNGLIHDRRVLQSAGMRDLPSTNAAWMEECHDVYECCAFADCRRNLRADTVRLHSHEIDA
jgi:hypothetical protein